LVVGGCGASTQWCEYPVRRVHCDRQPKRLHADLGKLAAAGQVQLLEVYEQRHGDTFTRRRAACPASRPAGSAAGALERWRCSGGGDEGGGEEHVGRLGCERAELRWRAGRGGEGGVARGGAEEV
jgi:hypothetical protein